MWLLSEWLILPLPTRPPVLLLLHFQPFKHPHIRQLHMQTEWNTWKLCLKWSLARWRDWSKGRLIIAVVDHRLPSTRSGWIYYRRLDCSVLTLCERHFNSVACAEKLRGRRVDYPHDFMHNDFSHRSNCFCLAGPLRQGPMYVLRMQRMIDAACQDSIMAVSLFLHCLRVTL